VQIWQWRRCVSCSGIGGDVGFRAEAADNERWVDYKMLQCKRSERSILSHDGSKVWFWRTSHYTVQHSLTFSLEQFFWDHRTPPNEKEGNFGLNHWKMAPLVWYVHRRKVNPPPTVYFIRVVDIIVVERGRLNPCRIRFSYSVYLWKITKFAIIPFIFFLYYL